MEYYGGLDPQKKMYNNIVFCTFVLSLVFIIMIVMLILISVMINKVIESKIKL